MKTVAIVQARMSSTRFPGKILERIRGLSLLELVGMRLSRSKAIDELLFAISEDASDDVAASEINRLGYRCFRGSLDDVQQRFIECAEFFGATNIVRITADCPLIDWGVVDAVVELFLESGVDYASNTIEPTFPDGLDVEVFSLASLRESRKISDSPLGREHVTYELRLSQGLKAQSFTHSSDFSGLRWTVDYPDDLRQIEYLLPEDFQNLSWLDLIDRGFTGVQSNKKRNEGILMGKGQKLWSRAKEIIPGGGMLLSKRSEMFLPAQWPSYYSKAKGIEVTDLDGNKFLDFSTMSVGTCSLGYGVDSINDAVKDAVNDGVMSTLNSPAEVELAERLVALHPWSDMVRFARTGGEANAIAVRIARAKTSKDKIAICGYHGWHDWYLSANLSSESNLDGHLLPGLEPAGVPRGLVGTTVPFEYNDIDGLRELLASGDFAAVKMEVSRNFGPQEGFLQAVRDLCTKHGVVLIFDECTSGFRETFGGLHLKYGVSPDLAMFGKALGNGFAITAVVGKAIVMQAAQSTFISSTFWTERLGPVAALATLDVMEKTKSWEKISANGAKIKNHWRETFSKLGLEVNIGGLDALATFTSADPAWISMKTLFTQEMLRKGMLATTAFYSSTAHADESMQRYFKAFDEVFQEIIELKNDGALDSRLEGPLAHGGFKRLN